jgi:hypothetical protein
VLRHSAVFVHRIDLQLPSYLDRNRTLPSIARAGTGGFEHDSVNHLRGMFRISGVVAGA